MFGVSTKENPEMTANNYNITLEFA